VDQKKLDHCDVSNGKALPITSENEVVASGKLFV
jgi:hypothetical protein